MRVLVVSVILSASLVVAAGAQQPQSGMPGDVGASSISGTVTATETSRPLVRARVVLQQDGRDIAATATDRDGAFQFEGLKAGSYLVSADASAYVERAYAGPSDRAMPLPVQIGDRQALRRIDIRLMRGGIMSGAVVSRAGEPLAGVGVSIVPATDRVAQRPAVTVLTNDRGDFRAWGLTPGRYRLSVGALTYPPDATEPTTFEVSSGQEITGAMFVVPDGQIVAAATPRGDGDGIVSGTVLDDTGEPAIGVRVMLRGRGIRLRDRRPSTSALTNDRGEFRIWGLAPDDYLLSAVPPDDPSPPLPGLRDENWIETFYPGTVSANAAQRIPIESGELPFITFTMQRMVGATISGIATGPAGAQEFVGAAALVPDEGRGAGDEDATYYADVAAGGRFEFTRVPPGNYLVEATSRGQGVVLYGADSITIAGSRASNVVIALQPMPALAGDIVWHGGPGEQFAANLLRITAPRTRETLAMPPSPAAIEVSGRFRITAATPGRHILNVDGIPPGWALDSAWLDGRRLEGLEFEVPAEEKELTGLRLLFTRSSAAGAP